MKVEPVRHGDARRVVMETARAVLAVEEPLRCSEWCERYFYLSDQSSAVSGKFSCWPFQRAPLDLWGSGLIEICDFTKSSRVGFTKCLVGFTAYCIERLRLKPIIYQPTDDDAKEFAKDSIDPMLADCPRVGDLLVGDKRQDTLLHKKFVNGSVLHIKGAHTPNNFRRLTKDVVIYDEVDAFQLNVGREGDAIALGDKRVSDSPFRFSLRGTTPTEESRSVMYKHEQSAALRFEFVLPCPSCGDFAPIAWVGEPKKNTEVRGGLVWDGDDPDSVRNVCGACGGHWTYDRLEDRVRLGHWRAQDGSCIDSEDTFRLVDRDGADIGWPRHVAFFLWAAYSPLLRWSDIVREYLEIGGDVEREQAFMNTSLGRYWNDITEELDDRELAKQKRDYLGELDGKTSIPDEVMVITFGVDVQADRVEAELVGWGLGRESWSLGYLIEYGDTDGQRVWDNLYTWLSQWFVRPRKGRIRAQLGFVDSGYASERAYAFSRKFGRNWAVPCKGLGGDPRGPIVSMSDRIDPRHRTMLAIVATNKVKNTMFRQLAKKTEGYGYCHFPMSHGAYDDEHFAQLTAERKVRVKKMGQMREEYQKTRDRNEALDVRCYALAAALLLELKERVVFFPPRVFEDQQ